MKKDYLKIEMSKKSLDKIIFGLIAVLAILVIYNQIQISSLSGLGVKADVPTGATIVEASVIPTGTPEIYGPELNIKYDDVSPNDPRKADQTISVMADLDRTITLTGADLERYIDITSQISCEYCCGAKSIIVTNEDVERTNKQIEAAISSGQVTEQEAGRYRKDAGTAACGCAHSYAMRGLAKYLITEQGNGFSDDEILEELGKWKTLFFPSQIQAKAQILEGKGIELNYINLASNIYRDIEKGSSSGSGMVGGC